MSEIDILPEASRWRARDVRHFGGRWEQVKSIIPEFELTDFSIAPDEPANPFLRSVVRKPLTATERRIPVGVVSNTYALIQHAAVGELCLAGMRKVGIDVAQVPCEVGLSELGEWMNLRLYFPSEYSFTSRDRETLDLRVEAFNSVDGSSRLVVLLGWLRFVCSNGLVVGESLVEVRDIHSIPIDLSKIEQAIAKGTRKAKLDEKRFEIWQVRAVDPGAIVQWVDKTISDCWGKKAACRVFHICTSGCDVELIDPFAPGPASEKPVQRLELVPGAPVPAANLYDVCQALSWVATRRNNAEERIEWQVEIPALIRALAA